MTRTTPYAGRHDPVLDPPNGKVRVRGREFSDEEMRVRLGNITKRAGEMKRIYADLHDFAYSPSGSGGDKVSGVDSNPTEQAALDLQKRAIRGALPDICALVELAERAIKRAKKKATIHDRVPGEPVGSKLDVWDEEKAQRAEDRMSRRRHPGTVNPSRKAEHAGQTHV